MIIYWHFFFELGLQVEFLYGFKSHPPEFEYQDLWFSKPILIAVQKDWVMWLELQLLLI